MKRHYDENNADNTDHDEDEDEFSGYAITDDTGTEILREMKKKKKNVYEDDEVVEASVIPENEQTVMIDNPKLSGIKVGDMLTLVIKNEEAAFVYNEKKKVGELKPAFVKKLFESRKDWHAQCFLYSDSFPIMVKIKFSERARKNSIKIQC